MIIAEQEQTLRIGQEAIPFSLKQGKPNRIRLSFSHDNQLCIETSNGRLGEFEREFLASKRKWILRGFRIRRDEHQKKTALLSDVENRVPILGVETEIRYTPAEKTYFNYETDKLFTVFAPGIYLKDQKKKILYYALRGFAERYLIRRVEHWTAETELTFNKLRIKDLRSKWGSCSSLQNINLNWQLIFLEPTLIDYVIIHELMHLREMNHSQQFWAWVGRYYPNYKTARKQLKEKTWLVGILK